MANILGIDPSLTATGTCLQTEESIYPEEIIIPEKGPLRLIKIRESISGIINSYSPNLIILEGYAFGRINQAHQLGELGGVIRVLLYENGFKEGRDLFIIPPTTLKKFVLGKGIGKKELILKEVYKRWNFDTDSNNIADAFALSQLGGCILNQEEYNVLNKSQKEVIDKIKGANDEKHKHNVRSRKRGSGGTI